MTTFIWILIGFAAGALITGLLGLSRLTAMKAEHKAGENSLSEAQKRGQELEEARNQLAQELSEASIQAAGLEADLKIASERYEEKTQTLAEAEKRFSETFKALGADALKANTEQFLELAKQTFEASQEAIKGDLGEKQTHLKGLLKPMHEMLQHGAFL